jgi:hypothetical protein
MDILSSSVDFSQFKYLCFIDSDVESAYKFSTFLNDLTYPIVYSYEESDRESLKTSILTKFTQIERISFVFHGPPDNSFTPKRFINNEPYFDLDNTTISDNNNSLFLEELFVTLNVQHADFLACNLLQQQPWKDYFASFGNNVTIGASEDATGNLKYGGDWIMENTMEDVRDIYFKSSIENFASILAQATTLLYYDAVNCITLRFVNASGTNATITPGYTLDAGITTFNLNIPSQIYANGTPGTKYTVTSIGNYAFDQSAATASVKGYMKILTIPSTVNVIGTSSFKSNVNMTCDFTNTAVSSFYANAFANCLCLCDTTGGLLTLPNVCSSIGNYAFDNCNITSIIIKNGSASTLTLETSSLGYNKLINILIYPRSIISLPGTNHFYGGLVSHTYFIVPTGITNLSSSEYVFTQNLSLTVFFSSTTLPTMSMYTFSRTASDHSNVEFYYLENTDLTNLTNVYSANTRTPLTMISSYNFYVKDTDTVISSPVLLDQAVDFKIVFVYAQTSFNSGTDITVSNGVLSTMTATDATNLVYKGTFTPTSNIISTTGNNLNICANKYAIRDTIFGWAHISATTSLISYSIDTITSTSLVSISFPNEDCSLSPTFSFDTYDYIATNVATIPYTVTLTPTAHSTDTTISVNNNSVISGFPITLTLVIGSVNTISIVLTKEEATKTYTITFPAVFSKSTTILSALNTANSASTQRFQININNTTLTSPIVQYVQDISQNALGYTSNAVNQRFIFGSALLSNPLELNSTVNAAGTEISSNVKANNFLMYSDVRLKKNIEVLTELQCIDNIRVVQYNNKSDDSKHFGVIAHELAEIYPELVDGEKNGEIMQSVSYLELIPICINEIQLLKKQAALLDAL